MITAAPAFTPVIIPVLPMVIVLLVLLQMPPLTASAAVMVDPWHTVAGPLPIVIGSGVVFTVIVSFTAQVPVL